LSAIHLRISQHRFLITDLASSVEPFAARLSIVLLDIEIFHNSLSLGELTLASRLIGVLVSRATKLREPNARSISVWRRWMERSF
jgi:putative Mn2+ efflux pump MntP